MKEGGSGIKREFGFLIVFVEVWFSLVVFVVVEVREESEFAEVKKYFLYVDA